MLNTFNVWVLVA